MYLIKKPQYKEVKLTSRVLSAHRSPQTRFQANLGRKSIKTIRHIPLDIVARQNK